MTDIEEDSILIGKYFLYGPTTYKGIWILNGVKVTEPDGYEAQVAVARERENGRCWLITLEHDGSPSHTDWNYIGVHTQIKGLDETLHRILSRPAEPAPTPEAG